jgi:hypothetical protein
MADAAFLAERGFPAAMHLRSAGDGADRDRLAVAHYRPLRTPAESADQRHLHLRRPCQACTEPQCAPCPSGRWCCPFRRDLMAGWAAISILAVNAWVGVCNRPVAHFGHYPERRSHGERELPEQVAKALPVPASRERDRTRRARRKARGKVAVSTAVATAVRYRRQPWRTASVPGTRPACIRGKNSRSHGGRCPGVTGQGSAPSPTTARELCD